MNPGMLHSVLPMLGQALGGVAGDALKGSGGGHGGDLAQIFEAIKGEGGEGHGGDLLETILGALGPLLSGALGGEHGGGEGGSLEELLPKLLEGLLGEVLGSIGGGAKD